MPQVLAGLMWPSPRVLVLALVTCACYLARHVTLMHIYSSLFINLFEYAFFFVHLFHFFFHLKKISLENPICSAQSEFHGADFLLIPRLSRSSTTFPLETRCFGDDVTLSLSVYRRHKRVTTENIISNQFIITFMGKMKKRFFPLEKKTIATFTWEVFLRVSPNTHNRKQWAICFKGFDGNSDITVAHFASWLPDL